MQATAWPVEQGKAAGMETKVASQTKCKWPKSQEQPTFCIALEAEVGRM